MIVVDTYENGNPCWTVAWEDSDGVLHEANFTHQADAELFNQNYQWLQLKAAQVRR